jgi:hypothetical protein
VNKLKYSPIQPHEIFLPLIIIASDPTQEINVIRKDVKFLFFIFKEKSFYLPVEVAWLLANGGITQTK